MNIINQLVKLSRRHLYIFLIIILVVLAAYSTFTAITFFMLPSYEINKIQKYLNLSYSYKIFPKISTLYSNDTIPLPEGNKIYFAKIIKRIDFVLAAEINSDDNKTFDNENVNLDIKVLIRSDDQWEKNIAAIPEISKVMSKEGVLIYKSSFVLPLKDATDTAEKIIKEIELAPSDGYGVIIQSNFSGLSDSDAGSALDNYTGEYRFTIKQPGIIEPQKESTDLQTIIVSESKTINYMDFWGNPVKVMTGRLIFSATSFVLIIFIFLCYFLLFRKTIPVILNPQIKFDQIMRKYASRIVVTNKLKDLPADFITVEIGEFRELLKIANDREKLVLQLKALKDNKDSVLFYVIDEKSFYFYRIFLEI